MNRLVSVYDNESENISLSLIQLKVLIFLNFRKNGAKFKEIQSWLERNKSQVSIILTTLKSKNLISRVGFRPQINFITIKGREIAMNELKNVFKSTPLLNYFENFLHRKEISKFNKTNTEILYNNRRKNVKINSVLIDTLVNGFKDYLKINLINKLDLLIRTYLKEDQTKNKAKGRIGTNNYAINLSFEEFADQTEKIVEEELKESLERIPRELVHDIVRTITNKIHDNCYAYFK
ncbi:MAG: hypothetical protein ACFFBP_06805 [Promethearchaeota archaeon]